MGAFFDNIVGNEALKERLSLDISDGHFSHAYILEGGAGTGRHTVALSVAAAISCANRAGGTVPCGNCINCKKIFSGSSPDVRIFGIEEDRASIGVDIMREIKNDMYVAPNDLDIKVYIIENADAITVQAQNAFLLSLEEPPEYVLFFLICENSTSLLETVRSRAPALRTQRLSRTEIEEYLLTHDRRAEILKEENEKQFRSVINESAGSIGIALSLLDEEKRKNLFERKALAYNTVRFLSISDKPAIFDSIKSFGSKRNEVKENILSLQFAVRDLVVLKKDEDAPLCFFEDRDEACELATHFTASSLMRLYDSSLEAIRDLEANANIRLTLVCMMRRAGLL